MKAFWKSQRGLLCALLVCAAVLGYAAWQLAALPESFQRVFLPAAKTTDGGSAANAEGGADGESAAKHNQVLRDLMDERQTVDTALAGACEPTTLYAVTQPAAVTNEKQKRSASARLVGADESYLEMEGFALYGGRYFYPDEYLYGQRVALIDEQLAVELFQYAEPLLEEISREGEKYRIIGIVRDHKRVGDELEYSLYVPYRSLITNKTAVTAMVYEAKPVEGAGGWSAFSAAVSSLGSTGTTISLPKERMNALMPLRLLLVAMGATLAFFGVSVLNRLSGLVTESYRNRLRDCYARELTGWLLLRGAGLALGYAVCVFLLARLFVVLVAPVYTFPEWVPAILVEPKDIATAFWNVWQKPASAVELRTPELLRARFYGALTGWASGAAACLLGICWGRTRQALMDQYPWMKHEKGE